MKEKQPVPDKHKRQSILKRTVDFLNSESPWEYRDIFKVVCWAVGTAMILRACNDAGQLLSR